MLHVHDQTRKSLCEDMNGKLFLSNIYVTLLRQQAQLEIFHGKRLFALTNITSV